MFKSNSLILSLLLLVIFVPQLIVSDSNGTKKGCYYKGTYYKGNWTDGCDFNCTCIDDETGYYKCHRRCQVYRYVPVGCVLKLPPGEECCEQPDCSSLQNVNGDQDDNITDTNGNYVINLTSSTDYNKGKDNGCFYKGKYHKGNWSDGCDFLCHCKDPFKGHYTCVKRCPEVPDVEKGCELKPFEKDNCCMVVVCNKTDKYTVPENNTTHSYEEIIVNQLRPPTLVIDIVSMNPANEDNLNTRRNVTEPNYKVVGNQLATTTEVNKPNYKVTDNQLQTTTEIIKNAKKLKYKKITRNNVVYSTLIPVVHAVNSDIASIHSLEGIASRNEKPVFNSTINSDTPKPAVKIKTINNTELVDNYTEQINIESLDIIPDEVSTSVINHEEIEKNNQIRTKMESENNTRLQKVIAKLKDNQTEEQTSPSENLISAILHDMTTLDVANTLSILNQIIKTNLSHPVQSFNFKRKSDSKNDTESETIGDTSVETKEKATNVLLNSESAGQNWNHINQTLKEPIQTLRFPMKSDSVNQNASEKETTKMNDTQSTANVDDIHVNTKNKTAEVLNEDLNFSTLNNSFNSTDNVKSNVPRETATIPFQNVNSTNIYETMKSTDNKSLYDTRTQETVTQSLLTATMHETYRNSNDIVSDSESGYSVMSAADTERLARFFNKIGPFQLFPIRRTTTMPEHGLKPTTLNSLEIQLKKDLFNDRNSEENTVEDSGNQEATINEGRCQYKGYTFLQGEKWFDGCDLICECEDAMKGVFKCRRRCQKYAVVPKGCVMSKSVTDSCCFVPKCKTTTAEVTKGNASSYHSKTLGPAQKLQLRLKFNNRVARRNIEYRFVPTIAPVSITKHNRYSRGMENPRFYSINLTRNNSSSDLDVKTHNLNKPTFEKSTATDDAGTNQTLTSSVRRATGDLLLSTINTGSKTKLETVTVLPMENFMRSPNFTTVNNASTMNSVPYRFIKTDTGIYKVRKIDGTILPHKGGTPRVLRKMLHATKPKTLISQNTKENQAGWCTYKNRHFREGTTWYDGCRFVCLCHAGGLGKFTCHHRCPEFSHIPAGCILRERQPGQCCKQLFCSRQSEQ